ncbi:hypothetical protein HMPREF3069_24015 [Achromobacter xylosoxidans]|jgi:hypothetical protein|uniref:Uncharacterized protein n=1 Tax=Alcaligenes xylosoxydans xylosoxydans TaxID=85698 RepID=A0A1R1JZI7_ALCXX|nr:hypothetical protein HMPREF3069_24015 [Achromobacter xylosoxidans]OMG92577.1 hypothetical protein BIZ92_07820 [Achromobacter xylosoxidans]
MDPQPQRTPVIKDEILIPPAHRLARAMCACLADDYQTRSPVSIPLSAQALQTAVTESWFKRYSNTTASMEI